MMITVTLKPHHWRIASRDLITPQFHNLVSSIIVSLSLDTRITREIPKAQSPPLAPRAQLGPIRERERERELSNWVSMKSKNVRKGVTVAVALVVPCEIRVCMCCMSLSLSLCFVENSINVSLCSFARLPSLSRHGNYYSIAPLRPFCRKRTHSVSHRRLGMGGAHLGGGQRFWGRTSQPFNEYA
jgi:hypothetical protein